MDFSLSEEQELLRKSARDFLAAECPKALVKEIEAGDLGYSNELWRKMADLGWMGLIIPEEYKGEGFSLLDLAVLFEEFGRAAVPGPMFCTTTMGALPIMEWGSEEQKKTLLPKIASGDVIMTMALSEPDVNYDPRFVGTKAESRDGGFEVTGTKLFVPYAHVAHHILVVARTQGEPGDDKGLTVLLVDGKAGAIKCHPLVTIARDKQFEVVFEKVPAPAEDVLGGVNEALPMVQSILQKAGALECAMAVGGAQQELEITAEHTKTRKQFDRPIGTFQAAQHRVADMFVDVSGARWTTYQAIWRLSEDLPAGREVAIAKAFTNMASQRVAASAQQLHGGLGVDLDYDLHFYFRRAKSYDLNLGVTAHHMKALEAEFGF
jgi:alkylation response protein AidB-like acyl-CoA dehydrogenase